MSADLEWYDDVPDGWDDGAWEQMADEAFLRGMTARDAADRSCCEHQPTCVTQQRSWRRWLEWVFPS